MSEETIYGLDFTAEKYDEIMFRYLLERMRIRPGSLPRFSNYQKFEEAGSLETALMGKKWFDYRFMHPVAATYLYAHHYDRAYRTAYARHISRDKAEHIKVLKHEDVFQNPPMILNAIWKGRQIADAIGAPYDFTIEAAIRHTLTYWNQKYLPRPQQIYSERVWEAVGQEWSEAQAHRMFYSEHPNYQIQNDVGSKAQKDHREFLVDMALKRAEPTSMLNNFIGKGLLTLDYIEKRSESLADRVAEAA